MYAVIESGGKQLTVREKDWIKVEKLDVEDGAEIEFPVLLVSGGDGNVQIGTPTVDGATVKGKVLEQGKHKKVVVFKYKPKDNYRKKQGHRQPFTKVEITSITAPGLSAGTATAEPETETAASENGE